MTEKTVPDNVEKLAADCLLRSTDHYLAAGGDFNGLILEHLAESVGADWTELRAALRLLVQRGDANVHWEQVDLNPHINRRGFAPADAQIQHLAALMGARYHTCIYPSADYLAGHLASHAHIDRPYTRELALGAAQFEHCSFDLHVLEVYRNDPRYHYTCSDIDGTICISTKHSQGETQTRESDQVLVETFGFSYDEDKTRSVAVYLRYLARLTPEHQQLWRARQLSSRQRLHPDYYRSTVLGEWPEYLPLLQAVCMEVWTINQMTQLIRGKPLFRLDFGEYAEKRPKEFSLLIRSTLKEFNAAVLLLDKVLSDNINLKFFDGIVPIEFEEERSDGRIEVKRKGTITLLDEYLRNAYRTTDWTPWEAAIASLRKVRKLRQQPAHAVKEDELDAKFATQFRDLAVEAYQALETLRVCLQGHPFVRRAEIKPPRALEEGKVWIE